MSKLSKYETLTQQAIDGCHEGESARQKEESGGDNIYYKATSACVGVHPPLTDMEQGIRDLGFARAAE